MANMINKGHTTDIRSRVRSWLILKRRVLLNMWRVSASQEAEREDDRMVGLKHVCRVWPAGQWSGNKQNLIVCRKNGPQWCGDEGGEAGTEVV